MKMFGLVTPAAAVGGPLPPLFLAANSAAEGVFTVAARPSVGGGRVGDDGGTSSSSSSR